MKPYVLLAGIFALAVAIGLPPVSAHPVDAVAHEQCLQCHEKTGIFVTDESFTWNPITLTSIPEAVKPGKDFDVKVSLDLVKPADAQGLQLTLLDHTGKEVEFYYVSAKASDPGVEIDKAMTLTGRKTNNADIMAEKVQKATEYTFTLTAPSTPGDYIVWVDGVSGGKKPSESEDTMIAYGNAVSSIHVEAPAQAPAAQPSKKGVCGPSLLALLSAVPLVVYRLRRRI
jgi:hypothetical protein